jgi:hypothetical protein
LQPDERRVRAAEGAACHAGNPVGDVDHVAGTHLTTFSTPIHSLKAKQERLTDFEVMTREIDQTSDSHHIDVVEVRMVVVAVQREQVSLLGISLRAENVTGNIRRP